MDFFYHLMDRWLFGSRFSGESHFGNRHWCSPESATQLLLLLALAETNRKNNQGRINEETEREENFVRT